MGKNFKRGEKNHKKTFSIYISKPKPFCSAKWLRQVKMTFGSLHKQVTTAKAK